MSRTLSSTALAALFAQETGECLLYLIEFDHADWGAPVRVVNNNEDVVSGGDTYSAYPVKMTLPSEDAGRPQVQTKLVIGNVDRQVVSLFRALSTMPTCAVSIALGSTPSTIEYGPASFLVTDYSYTKHTVEMSLSFENILNEPIPADTFNPADYAGLF